MLVNPGCKVILAGNLGPRKAVICGVGCASWSARADLRTVGQGVEFQIGLDLRIHSHKGGRRAIGWSAEVARPGRQRGNDVLLAQAKVLPQPFVISEDERL